MSMMHHLLSKLPDLPWLGRLQRRSEKWFQVRLRSLMAEQMRLQPTSDVAAEDIFIAGYPKSGNTWMQNLVAGVIHQLDISRMPLALVDEIVPHNERPFYRRYYPVMIFKTHTLPRPAYRRVIHLVRDGRDAITSFYHFRQAQGYEYTFMDFVTGAGMPGPTWQDHTRQWLANPYDAAILRLRYEDLLTQPVAEMQRLCAFVRVERDLADIQQAVDRADFRQMRARERAYGAHAKNWSSDQTFVRRGIVGSHRDEMPLAAQTAFNAVAGDLLQQLGYDDDVAQQTRKPPAPADETERLV